MPSNAGARAMQVISACHPAHDSGVINDRGILICAGVKLMYSIWCYNSTPDSALALPLHRVFASQCHGSTWPRASQDHRILSISGVYIGETDEPHYLIVFADSRGKVSVGKLLDTCPKFPSSHNLIIAEEVSASEYPILSSKIIVISPPTHSGYCLIIGVFGDSDGTVSIYLLIGSVLANGYVP